MNQNYGVNKVNSERQKLASIKESLKTIFKYVKVNFKHHRLYIIFLENKLKLKLQRYLNYCNIVKLFWVPT